MCGEQRTSTLPALLAQGSPPRVRGTEQLKTIKHAIDRITPACAGNRSISARKPAISRDHPRVCGEQITDTLDGIAGEGSPPRVRGTGFPVGEGLAHEGITPACAGNSRIRRERKQ